MRRPARALPQAPDVVDDALGLVCTLPSTERAQRRLSVHQVIAQAYASRELEHGVALSFSATDDTARMLLDLMLAERDCCARFTYAIVSAPPHASIELHVETTPGLAEPLKALYRDLGRGATSDV